MRDQENVKDAGVSRRSVHITCGNRDGKNHKDGLNWTEFQEYIWDEHSNATFERRAG